MRMEVLIDVKAELGQGLACALAERPQAIEAIVAKCGPENARPSRPTECADAPRGQLESLMSTNASPERGAD